MIPIAKKLYAPATDKTVSVTENEYWKLSFEKSLIAAQNKTSGEIIIFDYLYEIIGKKRMEKYLDDYLRLKVAWSIEDFGRKLYPEVDDAEFGLILSDVNISEEFVEAKYTTPEESVKEYGNSNEIKIKARVVERELFVSIEICKKEPTTYIEGGHF